MLSVVGEVIFLQDGLSAACFYGATLINFFNF
uniref:Uncharacterized protein n=1 Tax=Rhizophora mucronata TaxID=61149 RepID=A0A2P2PTQ0_RHIMU